MTHITIAQIPDAVQKVLAALTQAEREAFIVGGCVRDLMMQRSPKDWDVTTSATPAEIQEIFPDSFYENAFGTVGVKVPPFLASGDAQREYDIIEVTTYRTESGYSDRRRPDHVAFVQTLTDDLARRDFTMNAIALGIDSEGTLVVHDPFDGRAAIASGIIAAVGDPERRFDEDALRMMRAVRFAAELGFVIAPQTQAAIQSKADLLPHIALERVRDELSRIILSQHPSEGIALLQSVGLLRYIMPELEEGIGVTQNLHHVYTVWEHNLRALATCPSTKLSVRLAALLHDVAKPRTKRGNGKHATFYNHDHVGARMTRTLLTRLRYSTKIVEHATLLVDQHLFYYNVDEVTEAAVRRIVRRVGRENIKDLMDVRIGDRLGSGVPKAKPYKLRHFEYMVEKVSHDPISVKMLALNGDVMIRDLGFTPGPKIGAILDTLLAEVIDDASRNTREYLSMRARELDQQDLATLRKNAKQRIIQEQTAEESAMKKKYWVQ